MKIANRVSKEHTMDQKRPRFDKNLLSIVVSLLEKLNTKNIKYCHFKSNLHVAAGMSGDTDLDILIDRNAYASVVSDLTLSNFKRFQAKLPSNYPAVEDWIGLDDKTGKLVHLHLHWQLVAGEPNLKGYRIPWENQVLSTRVINAKHDIYTSSAEMEMLLLLVRAVLKHRFRDSVKRMLGKKYPAPDGDIVNEFLWLKEQIDLNQTKALATRLLTTEAVVSVENLLAANGFNHEHFFKLSPLIRKQFNQNRTYSPLKANCFRWYREAYTKLSHVMSKKFGLLLVRRRVPATGGLLVTFLGADGSGKSTQVRQTLKWLGWKLDVGYVYFGSGDGPISLIRRPLVLLSQLRNKRTDKPGKLKRVDSTQKKISLCKRVFTTLWVLTLLSEKQKRMNAAVKARNKGMVVVCDRYPQNQFKGFNDGPIINDWLNDGWPWSNLAQYEKKKFEYLTSVSPDLVIKLHVSESVSSSRKSDTPPAMIPKKIAVIQDLHFETESKVIELDADKPLEEVTLAVKNAIWAML